MPSAVREKHVFITPEGRCYHTAWHLLHPRPRARTTERLALEQGLTFCRTCASAEAEELRRNNGDGPGGDGDMARVPTRAEHARERLDALLAQVEAAREELDKIERTPEDEYALGSVLTWLRTWDSDQEYAYAAIKFYHAATGEDRWTVTGRTTITLRWHELWDVHLSRAVPGSLAWCSETTEVELP